MKHAKFTVLTCRSTAILVEGDNAFCGGKITKVDIERSAKLPEGYVIGTITKDENFWYKVIEI